MVFSTIGFGFEIDLNSIMFAADNSLRLVSISSIALSRSF
jgi:hypothetical protein